MKNARAMLARAFFMIRRAARAQLSAGHSPSFSALAARSR